MTKENYRLSSLLKTLIKKVPAKLTAPKCLRIVEGPLHQNRANLPRYSACVESKLRLHLFPNNQLTTGSLSNSSMMTSGGLFATLSILP